MISYTKSCLKNWRIRHALIIILVTATMVLCILYSSSLAVTHTQTIRHISPFQNQLFDAAVYIEPHDPDLNMSKDWPVSYLDVQTGLARYAPVSDFIAVEYGYEFNSQSTAGGLSVIGLSKEWLELCLSEEHLLGRFPAAGQEVLLPQEMANLHRLSLGDSIVLMQVRGIQSYELELTVVGVYDNQEKQLPCIIPYEDTLAFCSVGKPNCLLALIKEDEGIPINQVNRVPRLNLSAEAVASFLQTKYPGRQVIYPEYPMQLGTEMHVSVHGSSRGLLLLIFLFSGIAVFTVISITFLERRKEMSSLKVIGISLNQVISVICGEYGFSFGGGIIGGIILALMVEKLFPWIQDIARAGFYRLIAQAAFSCLALYVLTLAFPAISIALASADELLLNRTIPLRRQRINNLPASDLLGRKYADEASLSVLRLSSIDGIIICLVLCSEGEIVKEGQTLAVLEEYGGLFRCEWVAPHDGVVTLLERGRYIGIFQRH